MVLFTAHALCARVVLCHVILCLSAALDSDPLPYMVILCHVILCLSTDATRLHLA